MSISGPVWHASVRRFPHLAAVALAGISATGCTVTTNTATDAGNDAANSVGLDGGTNDSGESADSTMAETDGATGDTGTASADAGSEATTGDDDGGLVDAACPEGPALLSTLAGQWSGSCGSAGTGTWTIMPTGAASVMFADGQSISGTIRPNGAFSTTNGSGGGYPAFSTDGTIGLSACNSFTYRYTYQMPPNQGTPTANTCTAQRETGAEPSDASLNAD